MLALIGNLDLLELVLIAVVALMVFGKRLPEVSMRGAAQLMKLRREVTRMWREAGLEEELRKVRRDLENEVPRHLPTPDQLVRQAEREAEEERALEEQAAQEELGPEQAGAAAPLDPLSREALSGEPGRPAAPGWGQGAVPDADSADASADTPAPASAEDFAEPGEEDALIDPLLQARVEPDSDAPDASGGDDDDPGARESEKESA